MVQEGYKDFRGQWHIRRLKSEEQRKQNQNWAISTMAAVHIQKPSIAICTVLKSYHNILQLHQSQQWWRSMVDINQHDEFQPPYYHNILQLHQSQQWWKSMVDINQHDEFQPPYYHNILQLHQSQQWWRSMVDINQCDEFQPPYWQYQDYSAIMWAASTNLKRRRPRKPRKNRNNKEK